MSFYRETPKESEKIINSPDSIFFMQLRYHMSNLQSIALRSTNIKASRDGIMVITLFF